MPIHHILNVSAAPERVAELLCSEAFNVGVQCDREEVIDARFEAMGDTDRERTFVLHMTSYKHTKTGKLDRSTTEKSKTDYRFDKRQQVLHWRYVGEEKRVEIDGTSKIMPDGRGTRLERQVNISVNIPLIGKPIAKLIESGFKRGFVGLEARLRQMLAE